MSHQSASLLRNSVLVIIFILVAPNIEAAGFWNFERGTHAYSRGGAAIAVGRSPAAVYLNPASLSLNPGTQLVIDSNAVLDHRRFQRLSDDLDDNGILTDYPAVQNNLHFEGPSPGLFLSTNLSWLGSEYLTLGAFAFGPPKGFLKYDKDGPQRYAGVESTSLQVYAGGALSYHLPFWNAGIGFSVYNVRQVIRLAQTLPISEFSIEKEDPGWDVFLEAKATDNFTPCGSIGFYTELMKNWRLGASYQFPYTVHGKGTATTTLGEDLGTLADVVGDEVEVTVNFPNILRIGLAYIRPDDGFDIELAWTYENWKRNEEVIFTPIGVSLNVLGQSQEIPKIPLKTNFRSTHSVRLGGSALLIDELRIRFGLFFEQAAVDPKWLNAVSLDLNKLGITSGLRIDFLNNYFAELGGGLVHWFTQTVENSESRILDPKKGPLTWSTNNGTYSNWRLQMVASLGVVI